jgi:alpha-tubulin suppressor-like RCC1 family protein
MGGRPRARPGGRRRGGVRPRPDADDRIAPFDHVGGLQVDSPVVHCESPLTVSRDGSGGRRRRALPAIAALLATLIGALIWTPTGAVFWSTTTSPASSFGAAADFTAGPMYGWSTNLMKPTRAGTYSDWASVSAGWWHMCGIRSTGAGNGTLWCWGNNNYGQLGLGDTAYRGNPVQVGSATNWSVVSAGEAHTCGIQLDNTLWCWGNGSNGELGNGGTTSQTSPVKIGSASWSEVDVDGGTSCGIQTSGRLYCWGTNDLGQAGINSVVTPQTSPVQVLKSAADGAGNYTDWVSIELGFSFACGTRPSKDIYCWGKNQFGQLGQGNTNQGTAQNRPFLVPNTLPTSLGTTWATNGLTTGDSHMCSTMSNGRMACWGKNDDGQLGDTTTTLRSSPTQVTGGVTTWAKAEAGSWATCAIRTAGTLYCQGYNGTGAIGDNTITTPRATPVQDATLATTWSSVTGGRNFACGTQTDQTLWCWGESIDGELAQSAIAPPQIGSTNTWNSASASSSHACASRSDGTLWCWMDNSYGQLGTNDFTRYDVPTQVRDTAGTGYFTNWRADVSAGDQHTCATRTTGALYCWGDNDNYNQLGDNTATNRDTPTQVRDNAGTGYYTDWTAVSAGRLHTCGMRSGNTLWCWGGNFSGQLGLGDTTQRDTPTQVSAITYAWTAVSSGGDYSCAINSNQRLYCFGANNAGQIGDNTTTQRNSPTQVLKTASDGAGNYTDWTTVSAGDAHACAIRSTGALYCWGDDDYGKTGQAATGDILRPKQVGTATDWSSVASYRENTCATKTDRTVWCWGRVNTSQLGSSDLRHTPTTVVGFKANARSSRPLSSGGGAKLMACIT